MGNLFDGMVRRVVSNYPKVEYDPSMGGFAPSQNHEFTKKVTGPQVGDFSESKCCGEFKKFFQLYKDIFKDPPRPHLKASAETHFPSVYTQNDPANMFKFFVWYYCRGNQHRNIWGLINPTGFNKEDLVEDKVTEFRPLYFKDRVDRDDFENWIKLNGDGDAFGCHNTLFPRVKGFSSGSFVEHHGSYLDSNFTRGLVLSFGDINGWRHVLDFLPAWLWIVRNCSEPVYKLTDGWLFKSPDDAANFILFDVKNLRIEQLI